MLQAVCVRGRQFNSREAYARDKIPLHDFALKMQGGGGLCARGGVFAEHYGIWLIHILIGYENKAKQFVLEYIISSKICIQSV